LRYELSDKKRMVEASVYLEKKDTNESEKL
jgi:hypothetical protein